MELLKLHNSKQKVEFGDFQTPDNLALQICDFISNNSYKPKTIIEPTCGVGSFIINSNKTFNSAEKIIGIEINNNYLNILRKAISSKKVILENQDFFKMDWGKYLNQLKEPLLMIGNPPWVTNSKLSSLTSSNLPKKNNGQQLKGIEAITGKSNFDISEWMIIKLLDVLQYKTSLLAFLCKTSVARKVLMYIWNNKLNISQSSIHLINSKEHFNVSVDACLFICQSGENVQTKHCPVYSKLDYKSLISDIGIKKNKLLANISFYNKHSHLEGNEYYRWRSGIKHDSSKIMEFFFKDGLFINGFGETVDLEMDFLYPLYKSSDISKDVLSFPRKWVLITQKEVGNETIYIKNIAPKTYQYLEKHSNILSQRKSSIYKNKPKFSIFGIGKYSFSNYKIAISGLYKKIHFQLLETYKEKPIMVDDTCYLISCNTKKEAELLLKTLNSQIAKEFFQSFIFWDSKRPITSSILNRLDILKLSKELELNSLTEIILEKNQYSQMTIFEDFERHNIQY
ncbi:MAG: N-6 DNA methylase [Candidatus Cloacimonadota bacterium]|nr:N-6 DNA methylase [Candidatus Cloacimonadota bacterium]